MVLSEAYLFHERSACSSERFAWSSLLVVLLGTCTGLAFLWRSQRIASVEMSEEREDLTFANYGLAVRELAQQVADDGYRPDMILAIARGGLFVAGSLGYALGVKNLYVMNVEFYTGVNERLDVPVQLPPYVDFVDTNAARILVADDVADTGHTLEYVRSFCEGKVAEVRTAVVYEKPQSIVKCDYVWKRTDKWIEFPWSKEPPLAQGQTSVLDA